MWGHVRRARKAQGLEYYSWLIFLPPSPPIVCTPDPKLPTLYTLTLNPTSRALRPRGPTPLLLPPIACIPPAKPTTVALGSAGHGNPRRHTPHGRRAWAWIQRVKMSRGQGLGFDVNEVLQLMNSSQSSLCSLHFSVRSSGFIN